MSKNLRIYLNSKPSKSHSIQSIREFSMNKTDAQQRKASRLKACLKTKGSCQRMINHSVSSSSREYTSGG